MSRESKGSYLHFGSYHRDSGSEKQGRDWALLYVVLVQYIDKIVVEVIILRTHYLRGAVGGAYT
jgi:hypothetical protein